MKIVIAPDSFKESLSALEVAQAIETGFREVFPDAEYIKLPVADGGEGTVDALVAATGGQIVEVETTDPHGRSCKAQFGLTGDGHCAIIEVAAASGLEMLTPAERNPLKTSTFGTGLMIKAALEHGAREFIVGLGGSATNDAGTGLLMALGVRFLNRDGLPIHQGGGALHELEQIDLSGMDPRLHACHFTVACDVTNPLTGDLGASTIFGPQKGATPDMIRTLDANLHHFAEVVRLQLRRDVEWIAGAGAAGGLGAAFLGFLNSELRSGIEIITEAVGLDAAVADADIVITGEGRMDSQSIKGKVPVGVARVAKRYQKPVIGIAGSLSQDVNVVYEHGLDAVFSVLYKICTLEEALHEASFNVQMTSRNIAAILSIFQNY